MSRAPLLERGAYPVWREIATRWADNDAYGHVNNVVHYSWFDTAVNAWLIENGLLDIAQGDPIGLVVETGCRYAGSLEYPEPVKPAWPPRRLARRSELGGVRDRDPLERELSRSAALLVDRRGKRTPVAG